MIQPFFPRREPIFWIKIGYNGARFAISTLGLLASLTSKNEVLGSEDWGEGSKSIRILDDSGMARKQAIVYNWFRSSIMNELKLVEISLVKRNFFVVFKKYLSKLTQSLICIGLVEKEKPRAGKTDFPMQK